MQEALKEQAKIMQEAHRQYRQQKQAKFKQEILTLQIKHNCELEKERVLLGKKDKKIAGLILQLEGKREQSDETVDEESIKDEKSFNLGNYEKNLSSMRKHYEEVISSLKD